MPRTENKVSSAVATAPDVDDLGLLIADHCPDAIVVTDAAGEIKFFNPAAERLFGRSPEDMIGQRLPYSLRTGTTQEVEIDSSDVHSIVAEMLASETDWNGERTFVVSFRDVTDRVRLSEELRLLSLTDELTGLCNRRGFFTLAEQQLKIARRSKRGVLLILVDLDRLKRINDNLGHPEGDKALIETAEVLRSTFRESDIVARIGGDEFAVLAVETEENAVDSLDRRIQRNIDERNKLGGRRFKLSFSRGMAFFDPKAPKTLDELVDEADDKLLGKKRDRTR